MQQNIDTEQVVQNLKASWKESGLKGKLLFTFAIIAMFRLGAQLPIYGINNEVFQNLANGNNLIGFLDNKGSCDATVNDKPVLEYYLATSKNDKLFMINDKFTQEQYGIVTSKNNKELSDKIEDGLKKIKANGTYDKIYEKWFGKREETK